MEKLYEGPRAMLSPWSRILAIAGYKTCTFEQAKYYIM
jgi:hypothetical protein